MHPARGGELGDRGDVDGAPVAPALARGPALATRVVVDALGHGVDPAEAERLAHRLGPLETPRLDVLLVEAHPQLGRRLVVGLEPRAEVGRVVEEHRWPLVRSALSHDPMVPPATDRGQDRPVTARPTASSSPPATTPCGAMPSPGRTGSTPPWTTRPGPLRRARRPTTPMPSPSPPTSRSTTCSHGSTTPTGARSRTRGRASTSRWRTSPASSSASGSGSTRRRPCPASRAARLAPGSA